MAKIADATVAQCGMALALMEKPCSCVVRYQQVVASPPSEEQLRRASLGHRECHGTGQVAKFPMLRKPWEDPHTHIQTFDSYANYDRSKSIILDSASPKVVAECEANKRRGWVPVLTEKALWEAVWTIAHHVEVDRETGREGGPIDIWLTLEGQTGDEDDLPWGEGKTVAEALTLALCAAEGIEEVG